MRAHAQEAGALTAQTDSREEEALLERVRAGDAQAARALLAAHHGLLVSLARRLCAARTQTDDLVQAGYVGMLRAARRYDPSHGTQFITYAVPWALGEMRRALREELDETGVHDRRARLTAVQRTLRARLGRAPGTMELAAACGMTEWELVCALGAGCRVSLDADEEGVAPLEERLAGGEIDIEAVDLRMALGRLSQEERRLILLRYYADKTQKETAEAMHKSQAQVSRIERRALDALRAMLKEG